MTARQVFGCGSAPYRRSQSIEQLSISRRNALRQADGVLRRISEIEMRRAFFLHADVQDHFSAVATHGFQMRFDDTRKLVQALLRVALGRR